MKRAFAIALLISITGTALWMANQHLATQVDAVPLSTWAIAALGMLLSYSLRARRLVDEWPELALRWTAALKVVLLHNAAVVLLPLRAGEAGYPLLLRQRFKITLTDGTASLVWLRLQDALVLGLLLAISFLTGVPLWLRLLVSVLGLVVLTGAIRRLSQGAQGCKGGISSGRYPRLDSIIATISDALFRAGQRAMIRSWILSACNWLVKAAALGWLLASLINVSLTEAISAALLGEVGGSLPLHVPAGFGAYEAGIWLGLSAASSVPSMAEALIAAFVVHIFGLVVGLLCATIALGADLSRPTQTHSTAETK
jgi:hypothetical protein